VGVISVPTSVATATVIATGPGTTKRAPEGTRWSEVEPPSGFEPETYALRVSGHERRSASHGIICTGQAALCAPVMRCDVPRTATGTATAVAPPLRKVGPPPLPGPREADDGRRPPHRGATEHLILLGDLAAPPRSVRANRLRTDAPVGGDVRHGPVVGVRVCCHSVAPCRRGVDEVYAASPCAPLGNFAPLTLTRFPLPGNFVNVRRTR
jgi:hypothetical protein